MGFDRHFFSKDRKQLENWVRDHNRLLLSLSKGRYRMMLGVKYRRGKRLWRTYLVHNKRILDQSNLVSAHAQVASHGWPEVAFSLTSRAARSFAKITELNVGKRFAIVLDSLVDSAPIIMEKIAGGNIRFSLYTLNGMQALQRAHLMAAVLNSKPLPVGFSLVREQILNGPKAKLCTKPSSDWVWSFCQVP